MSGIVDLLIPREKKFFEFLLNQVKGLNNSSKSLQDLSLKSLNEKNISKVLKYIEEENEKSDKMYKEIITQVHESFITPIDRDELHSLTLSIDNAVNKLEKIITTLYYLRLPENNENKFFLSQISIINDSANLILQIFENPLKIKLNTESINQINKHYKKSQHELRKSLNHLFQSGNALQIVKMKELYETTSESMKSLKDIADIFERVLINHS